MKGQSRNLDHFRDVSKIPPPQSDSCRQLMSLLTASNSQEFGPADVYAFKTQEGGTELCYPKVENRTWCFTNRVKKSKHGINIVNYLKRTCFEPHCCSKLI